MPVGQKITSRGFQSEVVGLEDQVQKAVKVYRDFLWENPIQNHADVAELPLPTKIVFADGREMDFDDYIKTRQARCVLVDTGLIAGWLTIHNKGDMGWYPFWHQFDPGTAPHLCIDPYNHRNFFIVGGKMKFTERGVVNE